MNTTSISGYVWVGAIAIFYWAVQYAGVYVLYSTLGLSTEVLAIGALLALISTVIFVWFPQMIIMLGVGHAPLDPQVQLSLKHKLLSYGARIPHKTYIYIIADPSINISLARSHDSLYIYLTQGCLDHLTGAHVEGMLAYLIHVLEDKRLYVSTVIVALASLLERSMIGALIAQGLIHTMPIQPRDEVWDARAREAIDDPIIYIKTLLIISSETHTSPIVSSMSGLSYTNIARGIHTHDTGFAMHISEKERIHTIKDIEQKAHNIT